MSWARMAASCASPVLQLTAPDWMSAWVAVVVPSDSSSTMVRCE